jgi:hypothetical protein
LPTTNNKGEKTSEASPGVSSNVREPVSSSTESQQINTSRGAERSEDSAKDSAASPVSNPEKTGVGAQEEQQPSSDVIKQDPSKSSKEKRENVERFGQNKKMDAAD